LTRKLIALFAAVMLIASIGVGATLGLQLPGSNFEIDNDANLIVNTPGNLDWANVTEIRQADHASGQQDPSFGNGTKEDTAVPSIVDGGIPPNKSDLKFFGGYQEGSDQTGFLNLFWARVQDPSGTTNMDFEFNQSNVASANGVTPIRTAGDLLITYDLSRGGTQATISQREWTGTAWGPATSFGADATGTINTTAITAANADGLGALSPRTFGEAQISLARIFDTGECVSFGSAYLKSRSSDSFTSALKDFVPPVAINLSNCGGVSIHKTDDASPANPLEGAVFELFNDVAPLGGLTGHGPEDTATGDSCTTDAAGDCEILGVLAGSYWVVETTGVPGYDLAPDQLVTITVDDVVELTFVDPKQTGAITITKVAKHKEAESGSINLAGVDFTVDGQTVTTGADGTVCVDGLEQDDYVVHEVAPPTGYAGAADQTITVDNAAECDDVPYGGESATFTNTPLTDITVSVNSQIVGGTASTIDCDFNDAVVDTTAGGDGSTTGTDLVPGTYTCVVIVDP
jgi:uncharacterized surface anchored protein